MGSVSDTFVQDKEKDKLHLIYSFYDKIMHLSMLSPRGGGGGGPRAYVGHLTFQKNFWSKSPPWGPKIGSNQIKYPAFSINLY